MWEGEGDRGDYWSKLQQCTRKAKEFGLNWLVFADINIGLLHHVYLKHPSVYKSFLNTVCLTNLHCHLIDVWIFFHFFTLAKGVYIWQYIRVICGPSLALASTLLHYSSFCVTVSSTLWAEREMLPDRCQKTKRCICHSKRVCLEERAPQGQNSRADIVEYSHQHLDPTCRFTVEGTGSSLSWNTAGILTHKSDCANNFNF